MNTLTAVLEARRAEIDTRVERLRLEMGAARLWAQLSYLVPVGHDMTAPSPDHDRETSHENKNLVMALVTAGVLGATGYGLYALGMHQGMSMATA